MTEPSEDAQVSSPEDEVGRDVEEEDESGAPEKVAWPAKDEVHPLESADELREPRDESGGDVTGSKGATPDLEDRVRDKS